MNFNEYQAFAKTTDVFTENAAQKVNDPCFITKILGLSGEAGEVAEKFKKILRDKDGIVSEEDKTEIEEKIINQDMVERKYIIKPNAGYLLNHNQ